MRLNIVFEYTIRVGDAFFLSHSFNFQCDTQQKSKYVHLFIYLIKYILLKFLNSLFVLGRSVHSLHDQQQLVHFPKATRHIM